MGCVFFSPVRPWISMEDRLTSQRRIVFSHPDLDETSCHSPRLCLLALPYLATPDVCTLKLSAIAERGSACPQVQVPWMAMGEQINIIYIYIYIYDYKNLYVCIIYLIYLYFSKYIYIYIYGPIVFHVGVALSFAIHAGEIHSHQIYIDAAGSACIQSLPDKWDALDAGSNRLCVCFSKLRARWWFHRCIGSCQHRYCKINQQKSVFGPLEVADQTLSLCYIFLVQVTSFSFLVLLCAEIMFRKSTDANTVTSAWQTFESLGSMKRVTKEHPRKAHLQSTVTFMFHLQLR